MDVSSRKLRTGDVAARSGYSVQQIRDLERDGVLPPVPRTATGYRTYGDAHIHAALAYRYFAAAIGPVDAKHLMRADPPRLPALLDAAHARLHRDRQNLHLARQAAAAIVNEPLTDVQPADSMSITQLADALGVRASTLRHWESEGLVAPERTANQIRRYTPGDVRDARIVHQLRQAGYRIPALRTLIPQLRDSRGRNEVTAALAGRETDVDTRSRQLIRAAASLDALFYSDCTAQPQGLRFG